MWYQLGEAFGIDKKILEKYTACSPEESIIEVLDYWIRSHSGQPTWKEVAETLNKIQLHELAQEIEMNYKTGIVSLLCIHYHLINNNIINLLTTIPIITACIIHESGNSKLL